MALPGRRARALQQLLASAGIDFAGPAAVPLPTWNAITEAGLAAEVDAAYRALGGRASEPRLRPGAWDMGADGVPVELDEELHFNRYRAHTLGCLAYSRLPGFDRAAYASWCDLHEAECLAASWAGRWTNASAEREFGPAAPLGQLDSPGGAPRWKQRALYDLAKDVTPLCGGPPVVRVSIYDHVDVDGTPFELGGLLDRFGAEAGPEDAATAVIRLVEKRAFRPQRETAPRR